MLIFSLKVTCGQNRTLTVTTMTLSWVGAVDAFDGVMTGLHLNRCWRFGPQWVSTVRTN